MAVMEALERLFNGAERVKILRLFILNPERSFTVKEIAKRSKVSLLLTRREISLFEHIGFVKEKKEGGRRPKEFQLEARFPLLRPLRTLLLSAEAVRKDEILRHCKGAGRIKLLITSGIFIGEDTSRVDLLIVGDNLRKTRLDSAVKKMEADIGKELSYAVCDTADFVYRLNAYDKFIRDVLDYPHETIVDKLGVA